MVSVSYTHLYQLEVLKDLTPDSLEQGKQYIKDADINIKLKPVSYTHLASVAIWHSTTSTMEASSTPHSQ